MTFVDRSEIAKEVGGRKDWGECTKRICSGVDIQREIHGQTKESLLAVWNEGNHTILL